MEKNRAELRMADERYKVLFDNIPGATAIYKGMDLEIVMANDAMIGFWGKDKRVVGKSLMEAVPELVGQPFIAMLQQVLLTGEAFSAKEAAADLVVDGKLQTYYYDFTYSPIKDAAGTVDGIIHSATDVTELVIAKIKMTETEERLNFSLESAMIGTWNYDMVTDCLLLDAIGKELFGLAEDETLPFDQTLKHLHPDDVRNAYTVMSGCLSPDNDRSCDLSFRVLNKEHQVRWLHCTGKALFDPENQLKRFGGILRDISKEVAGMEAQQKLQYQKDNFLSIASHELKTPVTSIKAYAQLLERMMKKEGHVQKADIVSRLTGQVNRLTTLLDDLLDVSKISNDRLNFKRDYHVFDEIVEDNIKDIVLQDTAHEIELGLEFRGKIFCDRGRISQVISNLISNAIKYSPEQHKIIVSTAQHGTDVLFSVQDFGIGISEENRARVFDQFYRVSNAEAYSYQGMGLGLFISAEIIRQEGGRIWVDSEEGLGSTFRFSLPLINNAR